MCLKQWLAGGKYAAFLPDFFKLARIVVFAQKFQTFSHILLDEESCKKVSATTGALMGLWLFVQLNQQHKNKLITPLIIQITVIPSGTRRVK